MIVSHEHKFIFVKTTKTAGTSIEIALSRHCGPRDIITPISIEDEAIREREGIRGPQNYLHPLMQNSPRDWLRLFRKGERRRFYNHAPAAYIREHIGESVWSSYFKFCFERDPFDKAISRYFWSTRDPRPPVAEYLATAPAKHLSNWDIYTINDTPAVDFIGRYEQLNMDLDAIAERLSLATSLQLPSAKGSYRSNRAHYSQLLNEDGRRRLEIVCAKELRLLGYTWQEQSFS